MSKVKVFSGIDNIPKGSASDKITEGCICLEGGAFRGVYTSGVLDALMEEDINFRCTVGVSAGAMNGINYASGQIGRSGRINLRYRHDKRYVGTTALRNNKGIIGFDFVFGEMEGVEPLDTERLMQPERKFYAAATSLETGKTEYFEKCECSDIYKAVQASASMPFVSKPVMIDGRPYLDGGCSSKIPYRFGVDGDFEKVVVVRTRFRTFRKKLAPRHLVYSEDVVYKDYPEFAAALKASNDCYNRQCDEIELLAKKGRIFVLEPSENLKIGRLEPDMEKLGALYLLGYNDTKARIDELREFLSK